MVSYCIIGLAAAETLGSFRADRSLQQSVAYVSPAAPHRLVRLPRLRLPLVAVAGQGRLCKCKSRRYIK